LPDPAPALTQDLGLEVLIGAMAAGDRFLADVARHALLDSSDDPEAIVYRQQVLQDCLAHPDVIRELYELAVETLRREREHWRSVFDYPSAILSRAVGVMELYVEMLRRLLALAAEHADGFASPGFRRFFAMLGEELDEPYFAEIDEHLQQLRFKKGVLVSARLGRGNRGLDYVLRRPFRHGLMDRLTGRAPESYTLRIADRDENGARFLSELADQGLNIAANAAAQASAHILSFFTMLRREVGFYVACLNLDERLAERGRARCLPTPHAAGELTLTARGLYDPGLALRTDEDVVGNDLDADGASLIMITGANQGGKSTFLRGLGIAQLMLQAGMFVAAEQFRADVRTGLFTHYKREEDDEMESGKFDEELHRMSETAARLRRHSIVLFNESFAATDEREGSEIARQIIRALREAGVKVLFVTHMYDLAHGLYRASSESEAFLRAERRDDGRRTYQLVPGEPLPTSFGPDLYERIFANAAEPAG
jgi:hypothetical protein